MARRWQSGNSHRIVTQRLEIQVKEKDIGPYRLRPIDIVGERNSLLANRRRTNPGLLRRLHSDQHSSSYPYSYQSSPCIRRPNCRFEHTSTYCSSNFNPYATPIPYTCPVIESRNSSNSPDTHR